MKTLQLSLRQLVMGLIFLSLIGGAIWLWHDQMEQRWTLVPNRQSEAHKNNLLVAERLLTGRNYQVKTIPTLTQALVSLPAHGTLMILNNNGNMSAFQADDLQRWVQAGNTLILKPKFNFIFIRPTAADAVTAPHEDATSNQATHAEPQEDNAEHATVDNDADTDAPPTTTDTAPYAKQLQDDPITSSLGIQLKEVFVAAPANKPAQQKPQQTPPQTPSQSFAKYVEFPHQDYPLEIWQSKRRLIASNKAVQPIASDNTGEILRLYTSGKGHIVLLADNYFDNQKIAAFDHAEVLLQLAQLQTESQQILIVKDVAPTPWHVMLLHALPYALSSLAFVLLLVTWRAMHRFGPLLPDPQQERRSLLEHIDASAKWLWQSMAGRDTLLQASRAATEKAIQRRAPEIIKLPIQERMAQLHNASRIDIKHLQLALLAPVAKLPHDYTLQIQTLQKLRQFYER